MKTEYVERTYRRIVDPKGLCSFEVKLGSTDLQVMSDKYLEDEASQGVAKYRKEIEDYIKIDSEFAKSLEPVKVQNSAPKIVRDMAHFSRLVDVGPMASVAGAIAEYVGRDLLEFSDEVIVENGGDIFIKTGTERRIAIFAGKSSLSLKLSVLIKPGKAPLGICTSSGTIGPSLSLGRADASVVISKSCILADAAATAIGNIVEDKNSFEKAIDYAKSIEDIKGVILVVGDKMTVWGDIELV